MQQAFLDINGVPTKVMTWGKWVEESFAPDESLDIILCIPGNPGITTFYVPFLKMLHEQLGYPVWVVAHAGHEHPKDNTIRTVPSFEGNKQLFDLQGQIDHKIAFIEKYVPPNARIHFIGHSIGTYVILQLLKIDSIKSRMVKSYMLFPTIERMGTSPNGVFLTKIVKHLVWILVLFAWIFGTFPSRLQLFLVYYTYFILYSVSEVHLNAVLHFLDWRIVEKVLFMAFDEMEMVTERDTEVIIENKDKLKFYYGSTDRWVPTSYCKELKNDIPDVDAQICEKRLDHAFVLRHSVEMGSIISDWITKNK